LSKARAIGLMNPAAHLPPLAQSIPFRGLPAHGGDLYDFYACGAAHRRNGNAMSTIASIAGSSAYPASTSELLAEQFTRIGAFDGRLDGPAQGSPEAGMRGAAAPQAWLFHIAKMPGNHDVRARNEARPAF
jgi:hypothetical protein